MIAVTCTATAVSFLPTLKHQRVLCRTKRYRNLRSSSAKNAAERRSKSASVSLMGSPTWSPTTDRSGVSLICLSPRRTPLLFIKESHVILTSLSGFPSLHSLWAPACLWTQYRSRTRVRLLKYSVSKDSTAELIFLSVVVPATALTSFR